MSRRAAQAAVRTQPQPPTRRPRLPVSDRLLLTVEEAAGVLGVGRSLMYELIGRGEIETVRVGRLRRIRPEDLRTYVSTLSV